MITKKTTRIIGIGLIIIGLSVFGVLYSQAHVGQSVYSNLGCVVTAYQPSCTVANNQMTGGFLGMIFSFFTALFGASLVVPSTLRKLVKKMSREST